MSRPRKIAITWLAIVILGAGVVLVKDLRWKAEQRRRDAEYAKVLSTYQQNLRLGTTRAGVAHYLHSGNVSYALINASTFAIKIGEDPSNVWYCDHWTCTSRSSSILCPNRKCPRRTLCPQTHCGRFIFENLGLVYETGRTGVSDPHEPTRSAPTRSQSPALRL